MPPIETALSPRTPIAQVRPANTQDELSGVERVTPPTLEAAQAATTLRESVSSAALQPVIETTFAALQEIRPGESGNAAQLAFNLEESAQAAERLAAIEAFEAAAALEVQEARFEVRAEERYEDEVAFNEKRDAEREIAREELSPGADIIEAAENVFTGVDVRV